jgi:beta-mannosidase
MSKGIVRSVYLLGVGTAAIEHVQPRVSYRGAYPTAPLTDATAGPWDVAVRVHLRAPPGAGARGTLAVRGAWGGEASSPVDVPPGNSTVELTISVPAGDVALWWPNGLGAQTLYGLTATFTPEAGGPALEAARRVGFRFFALVTANDTDPSALAGVDGSGGFTMRFNVNGAKLFSRGANLIPMDEMEGRLSVDAHVAMLRSAADAHMNTLRVWGGGSYYPDVVYDTADELGLVMYHDAMWGEPWFGGNSGVPIDNAMQDAELRHQLRRLSHHPCILLWDGCNECGGGGVWGSFVTPTIADEDPSRPVWPACPSTGWASGVDRLTGLPNGRPLVMHTGATGGVAVDYRAASRAAPARPRGVAAPAATCQTVADVDYGKGQIWVDAPANDLQGCCDACTAQPGCLAGVLYQGVCYMKNASMVALPSWSSGTDAVWVAGQTPVLPPTGGCNTGLSLETHGYYQHGEGFATVNSGADLQPFDPNVPPALDPPFELGANTCPGTYASEFGASAWSSFESVSPTLAPADWNAHAAPMYERNYALDNFLTAYFNVTWPAGVVALSLKAQLYLALVAQALLVKSDISTRRSRNSFGVVTWQLNEIWPTGGWGGLEYGTVGYTPGQVVGGRWKPLHHFYEQHLFTDLFASCSADARCIVRNDDPLRGFTGSLVLAALNVSNSARVPLSTTPVALGPGAAAAAWACAAPGGGGACAGWPAALAPLGLAPAGAVLLTQLVTPGGAVAYSSFELLATPAAMAAALSPAVAVTASVGAPAPDGKSVPVVVSVAGGGGGAALLVTLTTGAQGRFSANAMVLPTGNTTVQFLAFGPLDVAGLKATLRVEHARTYV